MVSCFNTSARCDFVQTGGVSLVESVRCCFILLSSSVTLIAGHTSKACEASSGSGRSSRRVQGRTQLASDPRRGWVGQFAER